MKKWLRRVTGKWRSWLLTAGFCHKVTPVWRFTYPLVLLRTRQLCTKGGFEPAEAFRLGLFQPQSCGRRPVEYVSRKHLTRVQKSLNPVSWAPLLKGKDLFYRYCMAAEVAIPQLYAVVHPGRPGWTCTGHLPENRNDWQAFFDNGLPAEFVAKPAEGAYGRGFHVFQRTSSGYTDETGVHRQSGDLYDILASDPNLIYILQQRLHNHPELTRLSETEALQTVRMITLADTRGRVHLLHAHLKIIEGQEMIDTLICGLRGNIEAPVDLHQGTLRAANRIPGTGQTVMTIPAHPRTGVAFAGVRLPFWPAARSLVLQTAIRFLPVRTIGWDVALTPDGPVIVEGNVWWDPPNQHGDMGAILKALGEPSCGEGSTKKHCSF